MWSDNILALEVFGHAVAASQGHAVASSQGYAVAASQGYIFRTTILPFIGWSPVSSPKCMAPETSLSPLSCKVGEIT